MTTRDPKLTPEKLRQILAYDPETGLFVWRVQLAPRGKVGSVAGSREKVRGYVQLRIEGKLYYAHRLACFYMTGCWPSRDIDHRNLDKSDNRWRNLRIATRSQNLHNRGAHRRSRSGVKGVYWDEKASKWQASIMVNREKHDLGGFGTLIEAKRAYDAAAKRLVGEFARAA